MYTVAELRRRAERARRRLAVIPPPPPATPADHPTLARLLADPGACFRMRGLTPDPWQARFLADPHPRQTLLCCRRSGKTTAAAGRTWVHCLTRPKALAMVFSPTQRQSQEFTRAVLEFDDAAGRPVRRVRDNLSGVEWANGSRLLSLPDAQRGVVGFTPSLVVVDEASRVSDTLYKSVRPMLALGAALVTLSTPFGKRGWFFETWADAARLARVRWWRVTAEYCPRITPDFLAEERIELGERWFRQEWFCSFEDAVDAVFADDVIKAGRSDEVVPLFQLGV